MTKSKATTDSELDEELRQIFTREFTTYGDFSYMPKKHQEHVDGVIDQAKAAIKLLIDKRVKEARINELKWIDPKDTEYIRSRLEQLSTQTSEDSNENH